MLLADATMDRIKWSFHDAFVCRDFLFLSCFLFIFDMHIDWNGQSVDDHVAFGKGKRWIIIDTLLLFLSWKANSRCLREDSTTQDSFQSRSLSDPGKQRRESCWIADELTSFTQIMIGGRASVKWITGTRLLSYSEGQHRFPHEKDDQAYVQEIVHRYRTLWRSSSDPCHKNWSPTIRNAFVHSLQERSRRWTFCLLVSFNDR